MDTPANEAVNPFAPPTVEANALPPQREFALWRDGNKLVILKGTDFPPVCLKTGEPAEAWVNRTFSWVNPLWYLLVLIALLPAIIVLMVLSKKAKFKLPLSRDANARRKGGILLGWAIAGLALLSIVLGVVLLINEQAIGFVLMILSFVLVLAGAIVGSRAASVLTPAKITDDFAWFRGVHESVLETLNPWDVYYEQQFSANKRGR